MCKKKSPLFVERSVPRDRQSASLVPNGDPRDGFFLSLPHTHDRFLSFHKTGEHFMVKWYNECALVLNLHVAANMVLESFDTNGKGVRAF